MWMVPDEPSSEEEEPDEPKTDVDIMAAKLVNLMAAKEQNWAAKEKGRKGLHSTFSTAAAAVKWKQKANSIKGSSEPPATKTEFQVTPVEGANVDVSPSDR